MQTTRNTMRVIRDKATGRYFVKGGRWVGSPGSATKYNSLAEMDTVCRRSGLTDVELILETGEERTSGVLTKR
ncbi:MAG: hypothetical protein JWR69_3966 [Pedosphaera sp.]|nr:hypothetical protein [Pedosphaera sp.]